MLKSMPGKKNTSLDRVLGRLDTLDSVNLANLVQRLARERQLFEEIFNALQEGVLVIAADGLVEYANEAAHRLIGPGEDGMAGPHALAAGARAASPRSGRRWRAIRTARRSRW